MSYFRIFAISSITSLLFLSVFIIVAFDSENSLNKAYEHFSREEYYEARSLLINGDHTIPLSDFYLYEAYLAREELGLKKSQNYLKQAVDELKNKKSSSSLEIYLNLALNAYLLKEVDNLNVAIEQGSYFAEVNDPWIHFFKGCHAYLKNDYKEALANWNDSKSRVWLSNWMKTSFEKLMPTMDIELNFLHTEIENDQFWTARQKLENLLIVANETYHQDIHFLLALSYIKEGNKLPFSRRTLAYQKANDILMLVSSTNVRFSQGKKDIFNAFEKQLTQQITQDYVEDLSLYADALERWKADEHLENVSSIVAKVIHEKSLIGNSKEAALFLGKLSEHLPNERLKSLITMKITQHLYQSISRGSLRHLEDYWTVSQQFLAKQGQSYPSLAIVSANKILELVEKDSEDFKLTKSYINLWKKLEKNNQSRYDLALQLISKAQRFWSIDGNFKKATQLIKIAELLPSINEQNQIQQDIQRAIAKMYRQAIMRDHVHEFSHFQTAIHELGLNAAEIVDPQEINNQLADAHYFFNQGRFDVASSKVEWVLQMTPNDLSARKLAALSAYENGKYQAALEHFNYIKERETDLEEAFAISKVLTGAYEEGYSLLLAHSQKNPLSDQAVLRMAIGHLLNHQPDQSLLWLNKLTFSNDEILTTHYLVSFQKQEWNKVLELFNLLPKTSQQQAALQAVLIQAWIAQNQIDRANYILDEMLATAHFKYPPEESSKPFAVLKYYLTQFDPHDFAARYFLYVKADPEKALKEFHLINNPKNEILIERAELAYRLKHAVEAIKDLNTVLSSAKDTSREKTLCLLANAYLQEGFYLDSVRHFKELFTLNPMQTEEVHESYGQALYAIGRIDLANQHLAMVEQKQFAIIQDPKNTELLDYLLVQYPESLSLKMLQAKKLLEKGDNSHLILAYEMIESINDHHPYMPAAWLLQGQILHKLKFNNPARYCFEKAIALCPSLDEAHHQIALLELEEHDLIAHHQPGIPSLDPGKG